MEIADGGGVLVYSSLLILKEIMEAIIRLEKSYPDESIQTYVPVESSYHPLVPPKADVWLPCHYFDYIGGTGHGGLIAIMLGRLKMNVHDSILAFEALLKEVFYHKRWFHRRSFLFWPRAKFDHQILEQAIQDLVSHHAPGILKSSNFTFNENQCRTIVLAFERDEGFRKRQGDPYYFRTYNNRLRPDQNLGLAHHIPVWQVARATTASPTFFRPVIIDDQEYVGGSFGINNPCAEIYDEVLEMSVDDIDIILSIGVGTYRIRSRIPRFLGLILTLILPSFELVELQRMRIPKRIRSARGYFRLGVEALGQMETDKWVRTNTGSLIGRHRSKKKAATPGQGSQTVTTNPDNSSVPIIRNAKINIVEWFQPKIDTEESIRKHTRNYLDRRDVQSKINKIAKYLVQKRRDRVKSDLERWEKFCYETWYRCKVHNCPEPEEKYSSRRALRVHILDKHSDKYSRLDQEALEAALDEGQIRVV